MEELRPFIAAFRNGWELFAQTDAGATAEAFAVAARLRPGGRGGRAARLLARRRRRPRQLHQRGASAGPHGPEPMTRKNLADERPQERRVERSHMRGCCSPSLFGNRAPRTEVRTMAQIFPKDEEIPRPGGVVGRCLERRSSCSPSTGGRRRTTRTSATSPKQPIAYSHALHAGTLAMDCRYCHAYVERGPHAGVPPTQVCMNCHTQVKKDSPKLEVLRKSWADGKGDDVGGRGSASTSCPTSRSSTTARTSAWASARTARPSAARPATAASTPWRRSRRRSRCPCRWCLECHSNPAPNLRPVEKVTTMGWKARPRVARQGAEHRRDAAPAGQPVRRARAPSTASSRPTRPLAAAAATADRGQSP